MCAARIEPGDNALEPAPKSDAPTIVAHPAKPSARSSAARLDEDSASETKSLQIPSGQAVTICVLTGPSQGMEFAMSKPLMTIGRLGGDADIQIDDPEASRVHCAVEVRRDAILLHDLRSTNGTYVGDSRVLAARLDETPQFRIGSTSLRIEIRSSLGQDRKL
jgi:pSer/pThr/pTyr-binding forkhead associated (FHA) protein